MGQRRLIHINGTYPELAIIELDTARSVQPDHVLAHVQERDTLKDNVAHRVTAGTKEIRSIHLQVSSEDVTTIGAFAVGTALDFHICFERQHFLTKLNLVVEIKSSDCVGFHWT